MIYNLSDILFITGHGKSIVDGINGMSKTKLTLESAKKLKAADEAKDDSVGRFASHSMVDGEGFSAAAECKRMLEIDGTEGVKSVIKSEKRETNRKIKQYHYWVSDPKKSYQVSNIKHPPSLQMKLMVS